VLVAGQGLLVGLVVELEPELLAGQAAEPELLVELVGQQEQEHLKQLVLQSDNFQLKN
jgi:hypothetical protein